MKQAIVLTILTASCFPARADQASDRAAIETVMSQFASATSLNLFTLNFPDAAEIARLGMPLPRAVALSVVTISHEPWGEATLNLGADPVFLPAGVRPDPVFRFAIPSMRFLTPEVVMVDAVCERRYGIDPVTRTPVLVVMTKDDVDWRIASLRVLPSR